MHEISMMQGIHRQIEEMARSHGARRVHRVRVEVGESSAVDPEHLQAAFEVFRGRGVLSENAQLEVRLGEGSDLVIRDVEMETN
jgi:hydrogenase nickel incorporation protein HypA/HybF